MKDLAIKPVNLCKTIQRKLPLSNLNKHTVHPMKNVDCRSLRFVSNNIHQLNFHIKQCLKSSQTPSPAIFILMLIRIAHMRQKIEKNKNVKK